MHNDSMRMKQRLFLVPCLALLCLLVLAPTAQACTSCEEQAGGKSTDEWVITTDKVNTHTTTQRTNHQEWIISQLWAKNMLPAMQQMTNQMTAVGMQQIMIVGAFLDAKHQMETQRLLQTIRARAHKDYHPSAGMCEFGSTVKSLAASERKAELAAHVLSQRSQDRQMGNANSVGAGGGDTDKNSRLNQYKDKFCDPADNNGGLNEMCQNTKDSKKVGAADKDRTNKDIDFMRTVSFPWTLDADFSDKNLTDNEEEIIALASNLYGSDVFKSKPPTSIENKSGKDMTADQANYMDSRALLAQRSVAENSFNAITSMKMAGTQGSRDFLKAILKDLGVSDDKDTKDDIGSVDRLLGYDTKGKKEIPPSYYAQMEILTKKIYQNPDFYTNLYDKPANVERKAVAMQAIGLMQKFDLFKSYLRTEANLSVLLELAVQEGQGDVENQFHSQSK